MLKRLAARGTQLRRDLTDTVARRRRMHALRRAVRSRRPLLVGPWLGEVGFEVLYWIPFLRWVRERYGVDRRRVTVLSRGGNAAWYDDLGVDYVDIFDYFSPSEFKAWQEKRVRKAMPVGKQWRVAEFDREIFRRIRDRVDVRGYGLVHPSVMYQLFNLYWTNYRPMRSVLDRARFGRFPAVPAQPDLPRLPTSFVAAKFYYSECFPNTEENRTFARQCLTDLAAKTPVVHLGTGLDIDDHSDWRVGDIPGVIDASEFVTATNNLHLQTAVISRAKAFVGTYGGFSYLAPFYGRRSMVFYSQRNFRQCHLDLAAHVCTGAGPRSFIATDVADVDRVGLLSTLFGDGA